MNIEEQLQSINSLINSLELQIKHIENYIDNPSNWSYSRNDVENSFYRLDKFRGSWVVANNIKDDLIKKINETTNKNTNEGQRI